MPTLNKNNSVVVRDEDGQHRVAVPATLALAEELGAKLSLTSLTPIRKLDFANWENLGRLVSAAGTAWQWWVGDWINVGETLYGEDSAQGIGEDPSSRYDLMRRVTGFEQQTLLNVGSVSRRVARKIRRPELRFSHHALVAAMEQEDQIAWLDKAIENGWAVADLREAIRAAKGLPSGDDDGAGSGGGSGTMSLAERLEEAARLVWASGQKTSDDGVVVPLGPWHQLGAALGEET